MYALNDCALGAPEVAHIEVFCGNLLIIHKPGIRFLGGREMRRSISIPRNLRGFYDKVFETGVSWKPKKAVLSATVCVAVVPCNLFLKWR